LNVFLYYSGHTFSIDNDLHILTPTVETEKEYVQLADTLAEELWETVDLSTILAEFGAIHKAHPNLVSDRLKHVRIDMREKKQALKNGEVTEEAVQKLTESIKAVETFSKLVLDKIKEKDPLRILDSSQIGRFD